MTDLADSFCETIPRSIFTQYSSFEIMGLLKKRVASKLKILNVGTWKNVEFHACNLENLEIFDKNSADKIWSRKDKGVGSALPHVN